MCTKRVSYPTPSNSIADNSPPPTTKLQLMHDWPFAFKCNRVIACTKKMFVFFSFLFSAIELVQKIIHSFQYTNLSVFPLQQMARWLKTKWFPVSQSESQSGCHRSYSLLVISAVCPVILKTKNSVAHLDGVNQSTLVAWVSALVLFYYCGWK